MALLVMVHIYTSPFSQFQTEGKIPIAPVRKKEPPRLAAIRGSTAEDTKNAPTAPSFNARSKMRGLVSCQRNMCFAKPICDMSHVECTAKRLVCRDGMRTLDACTCLKSSNSHVRTKIVQAAVDWTNVAFDRVDKLGHLTSEVIQVHIDCVNHCIHQRRIDDVIAQSKHEMTIVISKERVYYGSKNFTGSPGPRRSHLGGNRGRCHHYS